jgi:glucose-6-phosphate isomerase
MEYLGDFKTNVDQTFKNLKEENILARIWKHDHTVWKPEPEEITNRLGWLHSIDAMKEALPELESFVKEIRQQGFRNALLVGLGGSSLAPDVFRKTFGVKTGYLDLHVLDSTDPGMVRQYSSNLDPNDTLYIVSTKSGSTVETLSFMKYYYNQTLKEIGKEKAGSHFIAITDPGSRLIDSAQKLGFRKIFKNDPNIGGRYSALTYFGLVPATLVGVDVKLLLDRAALLKQDFENYDSPVKGELSSARLGAIIGELASLGLDKLTFIISPDIEPFGEWVEQLIAESTGKEGKGILPVDREAVLEPSYYSADRLFAYLKLKDDSTYDNQIRKLYDSGHPVVILNLNDLYDLGQQFFKWETATAIAGWCLKINAFNQPNVEAAKKQARNMVDQYEKKGKLPETKPILEKDGMKVFADVEGRNVSGILSEFLNQGAAGLNNSKGRSYISLQAYVKPDFEVETALQELRTKLQKKYKMATTFGYGPRFLHSTGQLHKGDGGHGLFVQFSADMPEDADIPDKAGGNESSITFGILKTSQHLGDEKALRDAGRKVMRIHLGKDQVDNLNNIRENFS